MKLPFGKPGISRFVFVALLLVFNWPLLSIPASEHLLGWLFAAWGLAIVLLFLVAQGSAAAELPEPRVPGPEQGAGPDEGGGGV